MGPQGPQWLPSACGLVALVAAPYLGAGRGMGMGKFLLCPAGLEGEGQRAAAHCRPPLVEEVGSARLVQILGAVLGCLWHLCLEAAVLVALGLWAFLPLLHGTVAGVPAACPHPCSRKGPPA